MAEFKKLASTSTVDAKRKFRYSKKKSTTVNCPNNLQKNNRVII